ncbi:tyrosine-type recombinase/integrase [Bacillus luteolus]|uniref:Tyrosine-type recombinase/integrase n=1 Tax=Litchfieldia luteola TaxID=682179 RepID=A0ABR9QM33_9BACI|nr:tyrosine-type recombinase/integrase [Cytobacillus luteolus]MBE4909561.1 tyrosine-type recombinase/integrase [Cytobacillus luteolus]MBP1940962.1 integrase [Cytobacillus luteolus]
MRTVDAIKDEKLLKEMKAFLLPRSSRDYCLFMLGINTGIRIQDLLTLHVNNVVNEKNDISFYLLTSNEVDPPIFLNKHVRKSIGKWIKEGQLAYEDFLFKSRKTNEPITRQQAYRIINEAAKQAGVQGAIGTHTLRKTFGYHAYRKGVAISLIQKRLQHTTKAETYQYIGITKDNRMPIILDVNL